MILWASWWCSSRCVLQAGSDRQINAGTIAWIGENFIVFSLVSSEASTHRARRQNLRARSRENQKSDGACFDPHGGALCHDQSQSRYRPSHREHNWIHRPPDDLIRNRAGNILARPLREFDPARVTRSTVRHGRNTTTRHRHALTDHHFRCKLREQDRMNQTTRTM